jgi:hypothetical protein
VPASPVFLTSLDSLGTLAREVTVGSLLSRSFEVWGRNLGRFAGTLVVVMVPVGGAAMVPFFLSLRGGAPGQGSAGSLWLATAIMVVGLMAAAGVYLGAISYGAIQHLGGRPVRVGAMLRAALRRLWPLAAAGLLAYLATALGTVLLIVPGVLVALGFGLAPAVAVAEKLGPIDVLRRSWQLTHGHWLVFFLSGLVLWALLMGVNLGAQMIFGLLLPPPAGAAVGMLVYLFFIPLLYALPAVLYHELRVLKEGVATSDLVKVFE